MSSQRTENITCPNCQCSAPFVIWDSVNVSQHPELKEKILDESLFLWECPNCGHKVYVTFGTLYHDMENQFMLFFDHKADETDISEDAFPDNEAFAQFNKNYRLRYVHGIRNLKEKLFIFEEGLSDVAVEMIKYFVRHGIIRLNASDDQLLAGKELYFTNLSNDGEQLIFSIVHPTGGVEAHFGIGMNVYEQCLQKIVLDEKFKETPSIKHVCHQWIEAKLNG